MKAIAIVLARSIAITSAIVEFELNTTGNQFDLILGENLAHTVTRMFKYISTESQFFHKYFYTHAASAYKNIYEKIVPWI